MIETTLTGKTPDIGEENIKKLMTMFPEVVTEGKVDFEKLKQLLGEYVDDSNERYNFTWNGKGRALRLSQTPSLGTLRPCKEESKNWDTTQNLYIEGDNLEVLKLLQKSYYGKIKMIYIDPPYNTGKDFVYRDDFHDSLENYKRITGQVDGNGKAISTNTETSGRYHTDWLNMMYPRLRLARNLLSDDGVIFISIDDNEVDNLKKICNEIFGEDNFIANCVRKRRDSQANLSQNISPIHEYVLIYAKRFGNILNKVTPSLDMGSYKNPDNDPRGPYTTMPCTNVGGAVYSIVTPTGKTITDEWRFKKETFEKLLLDNRIVFPRNGEGKPRYKIFLSEKMAEGVLANTWLDKIASNQEGTREIKELFGGLLFNNPKPTGLLKFLLELGSSKDSIILDFFSGSATTAHAVMQLNAEDGGNRRFIMVQLPEPTDENSEAYKAGYMNISEIGKERIRRAGEKIKEEYKDKGNIENLDIGFKVFKLDTSNIRKWQPDYDNLEQSLMDYVDNFVEGRTELDVVYEIMLKYGLDLTYPVDEFTIAGKKVYSIGYGMLMICLDNEITTEVAKGILTKIKELSPESSRVVFKDNGFKTDSNKTNIKEILKSGGIEEFITI
ncbi:MAG TPA: site-specific DNA-methyltransferase [Hungateiclostridium thermocellum]|uniref:Site-specific DNA-methyltransferase (Adenine-specific) n=1 Tax=Acetivibrio thermocellus (strain ATCC 27405 / DSM 1237 / JCM 9322 / NBRC 103400 / NCIMB 10682 / NRRL B-4536 / VPI 7372) TaxID=203119 RepID=A3DCS7_ACET2|nr:site-specific DNA-methyltransferase [Acetivibrio thermocellus]ABN51756.1 Site-specific DNA-methyltransferase (adenine-specific) [Acetivibrio thermocellus ATCC 27405]HBW26921.1 site-specific DNA-methyltransferase [Acetivibrio thermocellus]